MKRKEIARLSGLKERTIRFYEEAGLLSPQIERRNGRNYREYTEADLKTLRTVASLRRAWFTLEEIRQMQRDPSTIQEIVPRYRQWLTAQQKQLTGLLAATERLDPSRLLSYTELSAFLDFESQNLPLPQIDVEPKFRYLDALEERPPRVQIQTNFAEDGNNAGYWSLSMLGKGGIRPVSYEDFFRGLGLRDYRAELENGTVASRVDRDSRRMRVVKGIFMGIAVFSGFMVLLNWFGSPQMQIDYGDYWPWGWTVTCLVSAALRGGLELYTWRKARKQWLVEMRQRRWPT